MRAAAVPALATVLSVGVAACPVLDQVLGQHAGHDVRLVVTGRGDDGAVHLDGFQPADVHDFMVIQAL